MRGNFDNAIAFVLAREGGYVNDPEDPGNGSKGTKWGISSRSHPDLDIANLTVEDAKKIYLTDYWIKAGCDELQPSMDLVVFDAAVNQGVSFALSMAHECDGDEFAALIYRLKKYSAIVAKRPALAKYLRGWLNRIIELYDYTKETT